MTKAALFFILIANIMARAEIAPVSVSLGTAVGKTTVMKTGNLVTTAITADQVVLTYTVTSGKTFYINYYTVNVRLTTYAATATNFGACSLESPAGTKLWTELMANAGVLIPQGPAMTEPVAIPSGVVVRIVCTPAATTSFTWQGNFGGYEK